MDAPKGSRLRAVLMQSILSACIVLVGLMLWRIFGGSFGREPEVIVVQDDAAEAYDVADAARRQIQLVERRAWTAEDPPAFSEAERAEIGRALAGLDEAARRLERLDLLLRQKKLDSCPEMPMLTACRLRTRIWALDARAVAGPRSDPSSQPGLYIPMHRALDRGRKAREELLALRVRSREIEDRNDPDERREALARLRAIRETLADCRDEFVRLEEFVRTGLQVESLPVRDLPDIELLRENASLAQQGMAGAGDLCLRFRE